MKKNLFLLLALFCSLSLFAQNNQKEEDNSKFGMEFSAKLGYGTLEQPDMVDLLGAVNVGNMLFTYQLLENTSISTGIGLLEFQANGVSAGENYALDQMYLRIPLYLNLRLALFEEQLDNKLQAYAGGGVYANTLLTEKIQTLNGTHKNKNLGWNGGFGFEVGMKFEVSNNFIFGIGFESQSDLSSMKKNDVKRKLEKISTANFTLGFKF